MAPVVKPTFAAVTCASLGVTGVAVAGHQLAHADQARATMAVSNLAAAVHARPSPRPRPPATRAQTVSDRAGTSGAGSSMADVGSAGALAAMGSARYPKHRAATRTAEPSAVEVASGSRVLDRQAVERRRAAIRASRARERAAEEARRQAAAADPQAIAETLAADRGWTGYEFTCLVSLWDSESGWDTHATNAQTGAYGIPQALPGWKMSAFGSDWQDNPETQIRWGLAYIASRYGTPCSAWTYKQAHNWY